MEKLEDKIQQKKREIKNLERELKNKDKIDLKELRKNLEKCNNQKIKNDLYNKLKERIKSLEDAKKIFTDLSNSDDDMKKKQETYKEFVNIVYADNKQKNEIISEKSKYILDFSRGISPVVILSTLSASAFKQGHLHTYIVGLVFLLIAIYLILINYLDFITKIFKVDSSKKTFMICYVFFYVLIISMIFHSINSIEISKLK